MLYIKTGRAGETWLRELLISSITLGLGYILWKKAVNYSLFVDYVLGGGFALMF